MDNKYLNINTMAKIRPYQIDKKERREIVGDFYKVVTKLKNKKDVAGFFVGLLTQSESLMFARRIQIAQMLLEDKTVAEIRMELGVGAQTVLYVSQWLHNDENDVFKKQIIKNLKDKKSESKKYYDDKLYDSELDKYPQHRMWKKLLGL
jgi:uncharacterized protein YerC